MLTTRKQVFELTLADLQQHPAWEFVLDEDLKPTEEATVRPLSIKKYNPDEHFGVVKATFELADGTKMAGYLTPPSEEDDDLAVVQPSIVTERNQVSFWFGITAPHKREVARLYSILNRKPDQIFPVKYSSDFPVGDAPVTGTLNGFAFYSGDHKITEVQ